MVGARNSCFLGANCGELWCAHPESFFRSSELAGGYALKPETLDFKGQVVVDANVSDMVSGWKKLS